MITIRREKLEDVGGTDAVLRSAFGREAEVELVTDLRVNDKIVLSLVAEVDGLVVGTILFSPVTIQTTAGPVAALGLAPMAVLPEYQRGGIGSRLVRRSLEELRRLGHARVVVLGHPRYYPRFGFLPSARFGVFCEYEVPEEAFMLLSLREGAWRDVTGTACYQPEFGKI